MIFTFLDNKRTCDYSHMIIYNNIRKLDKAFTIK